MTNPQSTRKPSASRVRAALLPLLALFGLSTASAVVDPHWIEADFNGDGRKDLIATTNLQDIVFNQEGEAIFWLPKDTPGYRFIEEENGKYGFNDLKKQSNLLGKGKALEVTLPGNTAPKQARPYQATGDENRLSAVFTYQQGDATVQKTVTIHPRQFKVGVDFKVTGAQNYTVNFAGLNEVKNPDVKAVAQGSTDIQTSGNIKNVQYVALQEEPGLMNSQFVDALIVRPQGNTTIDATVQGGTNASLALSLTGDAKLEVYGGKNELIRLYKEGYLGLPGIFDPNIWGRMSLLIAQLMDFLYTYLKSWGLVIVVITILIRAAIWPIMQGQMRYTTRLSFLQPEILKINEKYSDDPQKRAEATMALYKEHNVNPAGCLPIFIQIPILMVLWNTMRNFEFDSGLWWLPDLSLPDPFYILAVLYVIVNVASLYLATRKAPQMFRQQAMLYLVFAYFALTFPSGVTLYWILSGLIGIGQQILINRQMEHATAALNVQKTSSVKPATQPQTAPAKALPKNKRQKE